MHNDFENEIAIRRWRDLQADADPTNHADLTPALIRLLGWLNEGENCEEKGMRMTLLVESGKYSASQKQATTVHCI